MRTLTMHPPIVLPGIRLRAWLLVGRFIAPLSGGLLILAGILTGKRHLRRHGGAVFTGKRSLVGPSQPIELMPNFHIPSGVYNEVRLSGKMNLEFSAEELDTAYIQSMGPTKDLMILLRSVWSSILDRGSAADRKETDHFNLLGVVVNNSETPSILRTIEEMTLSHPNTILQMLDGEGPEPAPPTHVCFVNANNLNLAVERPEYQRVLRNADLVLPDGIGVKIALQMAGGRLRRNLNGTDLFPHLAEMLARREWPIFLLGATGETLAKAEKRIQERHPNLRIAGHHDGYFKPGDEAEICRQIEASGAMAVVIGMGTPRQELWYGRNAHRLRVPLVLSMGGLIDFLGEKNRRAPAWMRQAGLEWIFRIIQEPRRMWKRYVVGNPVFLRRVSRWIRSQGGRQRAKRS